MGSKEYRNHYSHELLVMSHSSAVSPIQANLLKKRDWDMVIVDEAHSMKNSETHKHKLLKELPRKFTLFLTATPIENNLRVIEIPITFKERKGISKSGVTQKDKAIKYGFQLIRFILFY